MRFAFPRWPAEFEIPDEWWIEAGMTGFRAAEPAFHSSAEARLISLSDIVPPSRLREHPLDYQGFRRDRLISVLQGIATGATIKPVCLRELPAAEFPQRSSFGASRRLPSLLRVRGGWID